VDRPGAPQSEIRVGRRAVLMGTPEEPTLTVLNAVLGGTFTSRLMQNLREERGFTYGAGSSFRLRRNGGSFVAGAAVHTPVTAEAVREFLLEIEGMGLERVPADELALARNYVALQLPQRFETLEDVAARVGEVAVFGLPEDRWEQFGPKVLAVGAEAVLEAAQRHLTLDEVVVVVVGDRAVIEGPLQALRVGPVETLDMGPGPGGDEGEG